MTNVPWNSSGVGLMLVAFRKAPNMKSFHERMVVNLAHVGSTHLGSLFVFWWVSVLRRGTLRTPKRSFI